METLTAERIAENESVFRKANEQIEAKALAVDVDMDHLPFLCECGDESCTEIVRAAREEYTEVRSHGAHFLIAPGHQELVLSTGTGEVVREHERFVIVAKTGRAGAVAEELDPRA
jgi:hypothetical protein